MAEQTFVIAGAAHAGGKAAQTLREEGFAGRIVLVGAEPHLPYQRPMLTKEYLRGDSPIDDAYLNSEKYYADQSIDLRQDTRVVKLSPRASEVTLSDGDRIHYDKLLLATGAQPRRLGIKGDDLPGIHYLRTIDDSDSVRAELKRGRHIVVIGGGWIGCEVAASARQKGCKVTVVMRHETPFTTVLGPELGGWWRKLHEKHGVNFVTGKLQSFLGNGSLRGVRLFGKTIECDAVVIGAGVEPDVALAEEAGLETDNGLPVDRFLETSTKGIFAAGDVANHDHPFFGARIRVEHWANAENQGIYAAKNMLGQAKPYSLPPFFFTDQYDVGMEFIGYAPKWDKIVYRGNPEKDKDFTAFWLLGGKVCAAMTMNGHTTVDLLEAMIMGQCRTNEAALADPDTPLATQL